MSRARAGIVTFGMVCLAAGLGAAPVTPSYLGVEATIERIREDWRKAQAAPRVNTAAWEEYFNAVSRQLSVYAAAQSEDDRLRALDRLYRMAGALTTTPGSPANELRAALEDWLRPRVSLAWAVRRLEDTIHALPEARDEDLRENRQRWLSLVEEDLGKALRDYESAGRAADRLDALQRVRKALDTIAQGNRSAGWGPSRALEVALANLFDRPNVEATADVNTLAGYFSRDVAQSGPVYRRGQVSQVTAGPKTGFGLTYHDGGIAFWNSQLFTSYTPIRGFQEQIAADQRGRRAAKLYYFTAASTNHGETIVTTILTPDGLDLHIDNRHNVSAAVCAYPQPGGGFGRMIAALVGQNRARILQQVYEGAIGGIRAGVVEGSAEESAERSQRAEAEQNARLAAYLIGDDTVAFGDYALTKLDLHSRPEYALIRGKLQWRGEAGEAGADAPKPPRFATIEPGVTADLHLVSILNNLTRGYLEHRAPQDVENLMIVTRSVPEGTPPGEAVRTTRNASFETVSRTIDEIRASDDPNATVLRVKRPAQPPEFAADRQGNLVVVVRDFQLDVSAPPAAAQGGITGPPARVYRIASPAAEFALSIQLEPGANGGPPKLTARVAGFDPGPDATLLAINQDEANPTRVNVFNTALILGVIRARVQGRPIDLTLDAASIPGFTLQSVSDLDPTGWMRLVLRKSP
jgi:hypothetical protein